MGRAARTQQPVEPKGSVALHTGTGVATGDREAGSLLIRWHLLAPTHPRETFPRPVIGAAPCRAAAPTTPCFCRCPPTHP